MCCGKKQKAGSKPREMTLKIKMSGKGKYSAKKKSFRNVQRDT